MTTYPRFATEPDAYRDIAFNLRKLSELVGAGAETSGDLSSKDRAVTEIAFRVREYLDEVIAGTDRTSEVVHTVTEGRLSEEALNATFARTWAGLGADAAFAAQSAALRSGMTAAWLLQGDSTGNATDEWVYRSAVAFGWGHPDAHIKYCLWGDAAQTYGPWTVVQEGDGEKHAPFLNDGTTRTMYLPKSEVPHITGDIDIRVRFSMDDWTPAVGGCIVARFGSAGARAWKMDISTAGKVDFTWSPDGTTLVQKVSAGSVPFTDGQTGWVRVKLDVDNGAGGYTWVAYSSTDGETWTEIGSSVDTTSGATSIFDADQEYEIGGRGFVGAMWAGKVYEVQIRDGSTGPIVNPQPITTWRPRESSGGYVPGYFGGGATLYIVNGSMPGANVAYFADEDRLPKMLPPYPGALVHQSVNHNDATRSGAEYLTSRDDWADATVARVPGCQIVVHTQNPQTSPRPASAIHAQGMRRLQLMSWAARRGFSCLDIYAAFENDPRGLGYITDADGIHPNGYGSLVWRDVFLAALSAAAQSRRAPSAE